MCFYTYIATFIGCQALCGTEFDANLADTQPQGGFTSKVLQIIVNMFCVFYFVAVGNCVWRLLFIVLSCLSVMGQLNLKPCIFTNIMFMCALLCCHGQLYVEMRTQKIIISRPFNYVYMLGFVAMGDVWATLCGVDISVNLKV